MALLLLYRVRREREVKNRKPSKQKRTLIDLGICASVYHDFLRSKFPLGMWKFASGNCPVVHDVVIGTSLLNFLAGKNKWARCR